MPTQKYVRFSIESRILKELGERLVSDAHVALTELIKNAYDADANQCQIEVSETAIVVHDDGNGMSFNEFESRWMRIATGNKAKNSTSFRFKRKLTGSKGVGRFAVRFLGKHLLLETIAVDTTGKKTKLSAWFDWAALDKKTDIIELEVPYTVEHTTEACGTTLTITKLRVEVDKNQLYQIKNGVLEITSPIYAFINDAPKKVKNRLLEEMPANEDAGFNVTFSNTPDQTTPDDRNLAADVLENYVIKATLNLTGNTLSVSVNHFQRGATPSKPFSIKLKNNIGCDVYADTVRISESAITNACKQASIPVCTYHRRPRAATQAQYLKQIVNQTRSFSIAIDISNLEQAAREIISVADGFSRLVDGFAEVDATCRGKGPAAILAHILGKPGLTNYFSRYATGPTLASDLIDYISPSGAVESTENRSDVERRIPFILGCWLYNYILPFPGILPNTIASASYVNLAKDSFLSNRAQFNNAKYDGPFGAVNDYWWRSELDRVLIDADCEDGVAYLKMQGITAAPSVCIVKKETPAGYYCLINRAPVSLSASKGRLSWIPEGADLCRIDTDTYDSIAPIMGL